MKIKKIKVHLTPVKKNGSMSSLRKYLLDKVHDVRDNIEDVLRDVIYSPPYSSENGDCVCDPCKLDLFIDEAVEASAHRWDMIIKFIEECETDEDIIAVFGNVNIHKDRVTIFKEVEDAMWFYEIKEDARRSSLSHMCFPFR